MYLSVRLSVLSLLFIGYCAYAANDASSPASYSPYADSDFPQKLLWGDTHLHTSNSFDAGFVNYKVGPEEAYRLAKGERVEANSGLSIKLQRPLDFLVVADHAEYLGLTPALLASNNLLLNTDAGRRWNEALKSGVYENVYAAAMEAIRSVSDANKLIDSPEFSASIWQEANEIAEKMNEPNNFTALIGFEWTSMPDNGSNLHRVVIFRDGSAKTNQVLPFTAFDSENPEDLWKYMQAYETATGGKVLAIPHNSNLSNGKMFALTDYSGSPITAQYARTRAQWEPLVEVTQIKGDSETHPLLSPNDEYADFGTWDKVSLDGSKKKENWMLQGEYVRRALQNGLMLENQIGENPFQFGLIGSTDSHTGLATSRDENFFGKHSGLEPSKERMYRKVIDSKLGEEYTTWGWEQLSGGLTAVWANQNTRDSIFDAMQRKEVYATTGTRIQLRLFGGWNFLDSDIKRPNRTEIGYKGGVPMGGTLLKSNADTSAIPSFMVWASKDPDGANLERIQIIKGWLDKAGAIHEKVFDVAVSENLSGDTLDTKHINQQTAEFINSVGSTNLQAVWKDTSYVEGQSAFYYVRVLEIPTPSWQLYDAVRLESTLPSAADKFIKERAYSSPIWLKPIEN